MFATFRDDLTSDLTQYEVGGLLPFTEYVFRVAAKNQVGLGAYSAVKGARTLETGKQFTVPQIEQRALSTMYVCMYILLAKV